MEVQPPECGKVARFNPTQEPRKALNEIEDVNRFHTKLLEWFATNRRSFPWRNCDSPFHLLIAEILLRKTQAESVVPIFNKFCSKYRSPKDVIDAGHGPLLELIKSLGLEHRGRLIMDLCTQLVERHGGEVPKHIEDLRALKGVGPYTANAVLCFGFGEARPFVDNNIARLVSRVFGVKRVGDTRREKHVESILRKVFEKDDHSKRIGYAMLDLAGTICKASRPSCSICPLQDFCRYAKKGERADES